MLPISVPSVPWALTLIVRSLEIGSSSAASDSPHAIMVAASVSAMPYDARHSLRVLLR